MNSIENKEMPKDFLRRNEKGSVLVYSLLLMFIMITMAIGISEVAIKDTNISTSTAKSTQALQASNSGVEAVLGTLKIGTGEPISDMWSGCTASTVPGMEGAAEVTGSLYGALSSYKLNFYDDVSGENLLDCSHDTYCIRRVKSVGMSGDISRALDVEIPCRNDCMSEKVSDFSESSIGYTEIANTSCSSVNGVIYCFGGLINPDIRDVDGDGSTIDRTNTDEIFKYDPSNDSLTIVGQMPQIDQNHDGDMLDAQDIPMRITNMACVTADNDLIYCMAGNATGSGISAERGEIYSFDPATEIMTYRGHLADSDGSNPASQTKHTRWGMACATSSANGKIYCAGGYGRNCGACSPVVNDDVYEIDVAAGGAINSINNYPGVLPDIWSFWSNSCANSTATDKIYCFGGTKGGHSNSFTTDNIFEFDPLTLTSSIVAATFPDVVSFASCNETQNKKIYCIGGGDGSGNYYTQVYEFDPLDPTTLELRYGELYTGGGTDDGRRTSCTVISGREEVYCFGGQASGTSNSESIIEGYSPPIGDWDPSTINCP